MRGSIRFWIRNVAVAVEVEERRGAGMVVIAAKRSVLVRDIEYGVFGLVLQDHGVHAWRSLGGGHAGALVVLARSEGIRLAATEGFHRVVGE